MNAARALREARRRLGITQAELARRASVPPQAVNRIERGLVDPTLRTLLRLLEAAEATLEVVPSSDAGPDRSGIRALLDVPAAERLDARVRSAPTCCAEPAWISC